MATNWIQLLKNYIGYQGATSLADKLTAARAGYLDNIDNANLSTIPNISTLSAARIGYLDNINQVGLLQLTAVRAGYLDNINNANLSTIPDISTLSAARIGYLDQLDFDLQAAIGAIPTAAMRGTDDAATVADGWDAALATILDNFTAARIGYLDNINNAELLNITAARLGYIDNLSGGAVALEASLTAIKGGGWATETLVAIKAAIDSIAGVNTYMEQIPDTDFALAAIDTTLTADPPAADAENSVVDIDQNAGDTFVLRSLWVNVTSFGTGAKLIFKLWTMLNAAVTMVDSVDVTSLGIQNLADIFGLQEVHADGIWITAQTDVGTTGACEGTYRYAKAS